MNVSGYGVSETMEDPFERLDGRWCTNNVVRRGHLHLSSIPLSDLLVDSSPSCRSPSQMFTVDYNNKPIESIGGTHAGLPLAKHRKR